MRLLVCGGRNYAKRLELYSALTWIDKTQFRITTIIHGACHLGGADIMAGDWASMNGIEVAEFPVNHTIDGAWPAAGPRRNLRMLLDGRPEVCAAFNGGNGTANMLTQVARYGLSFIWDFRTGFNGETAKDFNPGRHLRVTDD